MGAQEKKSYLVHIEAFKICTYLSVSSYMHKSTFTISGKRW